MMFRHLLDFAVPLVLAVGIILQIVSGSLVLGYYSPVTVDRDRDAAVFWTAIAIELATVGFLFFWRIVKLV